MSIMVYKARYGKKPNIRYSNRWYFTHRGKRIPLLFDKRESEMLAARIIADQDNPRAAQARRPLVEHIKDWQAMLAIKHAGRADLAARRVLLVLVERLEYEKVADIKPGEVVALIKDWMTTPPTNKFKKMTHGITQLTANCYLRELKQFLKWGVRQKRWAENPLEHIERWTVTEHRKVRRALSDAEIITLLAGIPAAANQGLLGRDREALFRCALGTGLRVSELASLSPRSFDLAGVPPTVSVAPRSTKNKREAVLPLAPDLAEFLASYLAGRDPDAPVWPSTPWGWIKRAADMLRADCVAAGVDITDVDFHALRHTFISRLSRAGVHPRTAQELARHSDINLTMRHYTHLRLAELAVVPPLPCKPAVSSDVGG